MGIVRAAVPSPARLPASQALQELQLPQAPPPFNFASSRTTRSGATPLLRIEAPMRAANHRRNAAGMNLHPTYSAAIATEK